MKTELFPANQFVVCLNNEGYEASLEVDKIYRVIPDETAEINDLIRVIDEGGEDYAFSGQALNVFRSHHLRSHDRHAPKY